MAGTGQFQSHDQYIATFTKEIQQQLQALRTIIRDAAPGAEEIISYNMPAFRLYGNLVYYAGNKSHIGFYPGDSTTTTLFAGDLEKYNTSKGAIQFPIDQAIPKQLVKKIVRHRIQINKENAALKTATAANKRSK